MPDRTIRALVVDDEVLARTNLRAALAEEPGWEVVGECESARAARELLPIVKPDAVFLDIQMPYETGLSLAREIVEAPSPPVIVFVTAFDQYAVEAFELQALDYLLKPFDDARLAQTLTRLREVFDLRERAAYRHAIEDATVEVESHREARNTAYLTRLCVRGVGSIESVDVAAVDWIASAGNYVELHLHDRHVLHRITMSMLERRLDPREFMRVHRTAIVRRKLLKALRVNGDGTYLADLTNGASVPVSERHASAVRAQIES